MKNYTINGTRVVIITKHYSNKRPALVAKEVITGEPFATITVNLPQINMEPDCAAIDVNNLGADVAEQLEAQGIIGPILRQAQSGYILYPIHKILI